MSFKRLSDKELVAVFQTGNIAAFDEIIDRHALKIYHTAFGLLSNHHDAEEVAQDALVRAFRALNKFRRDSSLTTWLHRITVNLARNKYHWNRRRGSERNVSLLRDDRNLSDDNQEEMALPDDSLGPERTIAGLETSMVVKKGLERLPSPLRETVMLRLVHDMPYEQIADALDCKIGTVKSRIARGREILREVLREHEIL